MLAVAIAEYFIGIEAAGKSLESVSKPLQAAADRMGIRQGPPTSIAGGNAYSYSFAPPV